MRTSRQVHGFTLIELIVVIGLMALLSTISIGGYFAASRGMAARGVMQDTSSIIRQAMQVCLIDQVPTAVLFSNRRQNTKDQGGEAYGTAVAIKMAGRISCIASSGKTSTGQALPVGGDCWWTSSRTGTSPIPWTPPTAASSGLCASTR